VAPPLEIGNRLHKFEIMLHVFVTHNRPMRWTLSLSSHSRSFLELAELKLVVVISEHLVYVAMFQASETVAAICRRKGEFFLQSTACKFIVINTREFDVLMLSVVSVCVSVLLVL